MSPPASVAEGIHLYYLAHLHNVGQSSPRVRREASLFCFPICLRKLWIAWALRESLIPFSLTLRSRPDPVLVQRTHPHLAKKDLFLFRNAVLTLCLWWILPGSNSPAWELLATHWVGLCSFGQGLCFCTFDFGGCIHCVRWFESRIVIYQQVETSKFCGDPILPVFQEGRYDGGK